MSSHSQFIFRRLVTALHSTPGAPLSVALLILIGIGSQNVHAQFGQLDTTFDPGTGAEGGFVESVLVQPDGRVLVCGNFTSFNGQPQRYIARLGTNGMVDSTFQSDVGYWVRSMALQPDGRIVIGGFFGDVSGVSRRCIARLNSDGSLDTSFDPGSGCVGKIVPVDPTDPFVFTVGIQPDGKIVIDGNFTNYNGTFQSGIARINSDGSPDSSFNTGAGFNSWGRNLQVLSNGDLLFSGWFTTYNNVGANRMLRVNSSGADQTSFAPIFGELTSVYTMLPRADGKIVVGGHSINTNAPFTTEVVRVNTDGSFDPTFNPGGSGANDKVETIIAQPDGKMIIGGYFNRYNNVPAVNLARLNPDGTLDTTFSATPDSWVFSSTLQPDGRLLICGGFQNVNGTPRSGVARLFTADPPPTNTPPPVDVPTNVPPSAGTFTGLFFEADSPHPESSGFLTLRVVASGAFTGKLLRAGVANPFSGRFDTNGTASVRIRSGVSARSPVLTGGLQFTGADQIQGSITNGDRGAPALALRAPYSRANRATAYAGRYTMAILGADDPTTSPGGHGAGAAVVDTLGNARVSGTLGDGAAYSQQTTLVSGGQWPFFAAVNGGRETILGWLVISNQAIGGTLNWMRPAIPRTTVYPAGFTNQPAVIGSAYTITAGSPALSPSLGVAALTGSGSGFPLTNSITWTPRNVITVSSNTNRLRLSVDRGTGLIQGSFLNPATRRTSAIRGAVIQNQNEALGWFPNGQETGALKVE